MGIEFSLIQQILETSTKKCFASVQKTVPPETLIFSSKKNEPEGDSVCFSKNPTTENSVKYDEKKLIISVDNNGQKTTIDLNKLLRRVHNEKDKKQIADAIAKMHPKALLDLEKEVDAIVASPVDLGKIAGEMSKDKNVMTLNLKNKANETPVSLASVITHELGHAVDASDNNNPASSELAEFEKIFNEELEKYKNSGGIQFNYSSKRGDNCIYATTNPSECFAEIYTLMHTEDVNLSPELKKLKQSFPKSIEYAKKYIEQTRKLSPEERNTPKYKADEKYNENGKLIKLSYTDSNGRPVSEEEYTPNGKVIRRKLWRYPDELKKVQNSFQNNPDIIEIIKNGGMYMDSVYDPETGKIIETIRKYLGQ